MSVVLTVLLITIILGLIFEFTNGFHDAANCVSTVIATKVLRPFVAIIIASVLNMIGATQISKVAQTLSSGLVPITSASQGVVLAALVGAILWNILTWYFGMPSSSSYALIGGLLGSGTAALGMKALFWSSFAYKVVIPMVVSPIAGFFLSFLIMRYALNSKTQPSAGKLALFGKLQVLSSSFVALSHGFNDAQKTMAIITLGLFTAGLISQIVIPLWVIGICAVIMALGTLSGGYRIINTVGFKITKLDTVQGFVCESSASFMIILASLLGFPLSTTHLIVGSVGGVGASKGFKHINTNTLLKIVGAWVFTFPGAFLLGFCSYRLFEIILGINK